MFLYCRSNEEIPNRICRCGDDGKNKLGLLPKVALKKGDWFSASVSGLEPNDFFKAWTRSKNGWIVSCYWFEWLSVCSICWISVFGAHSRRKRTVTVSQSLLSACLIDAHATTGSLTDCWMNIPLIDVTDIWPDVSTYRHPHPTPFTQQNLG